MAKRINIMDMHMERYLQVEEDIKKMVTSKRWTGYKELKKERDELKEFLKKEGML